MDIAIVALVAALTGFLSARLPSPANRSLFVRLSLGLSFSLFGLGVLDATPSSWNLLLGRKEGKLTHVTLSMAYGWVLWMIATMVVLAGPGIIGSHITCSLSWSELFHSIVPKHWMMQVIGLVVSQVYKLLLLPICRFIFRLVRSHNRRKQTATLPIHTSDKEKKEPVGNGRNNQILRALPSISRPRWSVVGGLSGVLVTITSLLSIGPVVIRIHLNEQGSSDLSTLTRVISCLSAVGILLSALLNGFGSVSLPFACLGGIFLNEVHPDAVMVAERELQKAQVSLDDRRREMSRDMDGSRSTATVTRSLSWGTNGNASANRKNAFSDLGEALVQRRKQLAMEIDFLETLVNELAEDVSEMRRSRARAAQARTPAGRVQLFVGIIFSVVLLIRLSAASISIWNTATSHSSGTRRNSDPVTMALLFMTGHDFLTADNYNTLSQFISLVLTAVLSFTQVRNFLRTLSSANRLLSNWYRKCYHCNPRSESVKTAATTTTTTSGKTSRDMALSIFIASLMTCYCLACSIMTKNMLPAEYRSSFSEALGGSEVFHVRLHVVNRVFFVSAVLSAAVLGVLLAIQRQNTYRYKRSVVESGEDHRSNLVLSSSLDP